MGAGAAVEQPPGGGATAGARRDSRGHPAADAPPAVAKKAAAAAPAATVSKRGKVARAVAGEGAAADEEKSLLEVAEVQQRCGGGAAGGGAAGGGVAVTHATSSAVTSKSTCCPQQHTLTSAAAAAGLRCDVCRRAIKSGEAIYSCTPCDFDACKDCCGGNSDGGGEPWYPAVRLKFAKRPPAAAAAAVAAAAAATAGQGAAPIAKSPRPRAPKPTPAAAAAPAPPSFTQMTLGVHAAADEYTAPNHAAGEAWPGRQRPTQQLSLTGGKVPEAGQAEMTEMAEIGSPEPLSSPKLEGGYPAGLVHGAENSGSSAAPSSAGDTPASTAGARCPRDGRCPRAAGHPGHCKLQGAVAAAAVAAVVAAVAAVEATACAVCDSAEDEPGCNDILLCDACDAGYHMRCLQPPLEAVPSGDWFCARCAPGRSPSAPSATLAAPATPTTPASAASAAAAAGSAAKPRGRAPHDERGVPKRCDAQPPPWPSPWPPP